MLPGPLSLSVRPARGARRAPGRPIASVHAGGRAASASEATILDCVDDTNWLEYKTSGERWDNKPGGKHRTTATVKAVDVRQAAGSAPGSVVATLRYAFKDGRRFEERTSYSLVDDGGVLKIDRSSVLSSRQL